ncbi:hypothetical protein HK104_000067 [Borealophlyctis nickersoniae]|nr:hypothetical protein HK104_000067 [Borealophlyctis nickersoniae]
MLVTEGFKETMRAQAAPEAFPAQSGTTRDPEQHGRPRYSAYLEKISNPRRAPSDLLWIEVPRISYQIYEDPLFVRPKSRDTEASIGEAIMPTRICLWNLTIICKAEESTKVSAEFLSAAIFCFTFADIIQWTQVDIHVLEDSVVHGGIYCADLVIKLLNQVLSSGDEPAMLSNWELLLRRMAVAHGWTTSWPEEVAFSAVPLSERIASDEEEWSAFLARVQQSRRLANKILYRRLVSATKGVVKQLKDVEAPIHIAGSAVWAVAERALEKELLVAEQQFRESRVVAEQAAEKAAKEAERLAIRRAKDAQRRAIKRAEEAERRAVQRAEEEAAQRDALKRTDSLGAEHVSTAGRKRLRGEGKSEGKVDLNNRKRRRKSGPLDGQQLHVTENCTTTEQNEWESRRKERLALSQALYGKLMLDEYNNFEGFAKDCLLIFSNCRIYNEPNSGIVADCRELELRFASLLEGLNIIVGEDEDGSFLVLDKEIYKGFEDESLVLQTMTTPARKSSLKRGVGRPRKTNSSLSKSRRSSGSRPRRHAIWPSTNASIPTNTLDQPVYASDDDDERGIGYFYMSQEAPTWHPPLPYTDTGFANFSHSMDIQPEGAGGIGGMEEELSRLENYGGQVAYRDFLNISPERERNGVPPEELRSVGNVCAAMGQSDEPALDQSVETWMFKDGGETVGDFHVQLDASSPNNAHVSEEMKGDGIETVESRGAVPPVQVDQGAYALPIYGEPDQSPGAFYDDQSRCGTPLFLPEDRSDTAADFALPPPPPFNLHLNPANGDEAMLAAKTLCSQRLSHQSWKGMGAIHEIGEPSRADSSCWR